MENVEIHKNRLRAAVRARIALVGLLGLLGGAVGVLSARLGAPLGVVEDALIAPLIVALTVLPIMLYEGWRRQRLWVLRLWVAAGLATLAAAAAPWLLASVAAAAPDLPRPMLFGAYALLATLGLVLPDLRARAVTAVYQLIAAFILSAVGYFATAHLIPLGASSDEVRVVLGPMLGLSIAVAYAAVPRLFEDVSLYVVGAGRAMSAAKFNNKLTGYWSMTGDQDALTIVDGTTNAFDDPGRIWIPEALVPELAVVRRAGRDVVLEISERNGDPLGRGAVSVNGVRVSPGRAFALAHDDTVSAGSVGIRVSMPGRRRR